MSRHSALSALDGGVHSAIAYIYANAAERTAATGFVAADLGKFAWQNDTSTLWLLYSTSPIVWKPMQLSSPFNSVGFTAATTTLILGQVYVGNVVRLGQFVTTTAFGVGTLLQFGTTAEPGKFLAMPGDAVRSYAMCGGALIDVDDYLVLTVSAVGGAGVGRLFYEVQ